MCETESSEKPYSIVVTDDEDTPRKSIWRKNLGKVVQQECSPLKKSSPMITKSYARRKMSDVLGEVATKAIQQETSPTTHSSPKITKAAARRILPELQNKVDTTAGASTSASHHITYKPISKGRIRVRNNPYHLFDLVQSLTEKQKNVVRSIGFSGALKFKLDGVPTCMGLRLITNCDHTTNTLHLGSHTISITRDLVRDVLGIPMGGRQINEILKPSFTDPVVAEVRNQFGKDSGIPTAIEVIKKNQII
ncbi:hypothetical protein R6Q59_010448 [Mikania micrantha]